MQSDCEKISRDPLRARVVVLHIVAVGTRADLSPRTTHCAQRAFLSPTRGLQGAFFYFCHLGGIMFRSLHAASLAVGRTRFQLLMWAAAGRVRTLPLADGRVLVHLEDARVAAAADRDARAESAKLTSAGAA